MCAKDVLEEYLNLKGFSKWSRPIFVRCAWCFGRSAFLKKTLAGSGVFVSKQYKDMYGKDAKTNMEIELKHWERVKMETFLGVASIIAVVASLLYGYWGSPSTFMVG